MYSLLQVSPQELRAWLHADPDRRPLLLDVRSDHEVAQYPFPGAQHIPMHLIPLKVPQLPRGRPIVVLCLSGARSAQVVYYLQQQGFDQVFNLAGGLVAWTREIGYESTKA
ncbi:MAG: rhodanese-like domain-containing protein [Hydrogenophilus sp.]|nr:rhodanese-like domain-containing protein [Hydrogenophilus sp.]